MENEEKNYQEYSETEEMNIAEEQCPENEPMQSSEEPEKTTMNEELLKKIQRRDADYLRKERSRVQKEEEERQEKMKDDPKQRYLLALAVLIVVLLSVFMRYKNGDMKSIFGEASNHVAPVTASVEIDVDSLI